MWKYNSVQPKKATAINIQCKDWGNDRARYEKKFTASKSIPTFTILRDNSCLSQQFKRFYNNWIQRWKSKDSYN